MNSQIVIAKALEVSGGREHTGTRLRWRCFSASNRRCERRQSLARALNDGPFAALSSFSTAAVNRNGWSWATGLDNFGFDYPLRALVAWPYIGGQGEKEAMYPIRYFDSAGKVLTGANSYAIHFDRPPPVNTFWSVTVYDAKDKMLVKNPIGRYKVGSDTRGLVTAPDGSITIRLQHAAMDGKKTENWLPTPNGPFYLLLRLYQPKEEVLNGTYQLPQVVQDKQ